jgi:hypothetical protein
MLLPPGGWSGGLSGGLSGGWSDDLLVGVVRWWWRWCCCRHRPPCPSLAAGPCSPLPRYMGREGARAPLSRQWIVWRYNILNQQSMQTNVVGGGRAILAIWGGMGPGKLRYSDIDGARLVMMGLVVNEAAALSPSVLAARRTSRSDSWLLRACILAIHLSFNRKRSPNYTTYRPQNQRAHLLLFLPLLATELTNIATFKVKTLNA